MVNSAGYSTVKPGTGAFHLLPVLSNEKQFFRKQFDDTNVVKIAVSRSGKFSAREVGERGCNEGLKTSLVMETVVCKTFVLRKIYSTGIYDFE